MHSIGWIAVTLLISVFVILSTSVHDFHFGDRVLSGDSKHTCKVDLLPPVPGFGVQLARSSVTAH